MDSIAIDADISQEWTEGKDQIAVLRGRCRVVQGTTTLFGQKMVIWQRTDPSQSIRRDRLIIYVEGDVLLDRPGKSISEQSMFLNLVTRNGVALNARHRAQGKPLAEDGLYKRAKARMEAANRAVLDPTQLVVPNGEPGELRSVQIQPPGGGIRRVRVLPRYGVPLNIVTYPPQNTTPPEQVWLLTGGINILIDGVEGYGVVDLSADRVVIWTRQNNPEFQPETVQSSDTPFQVYLEGNIEIRQGLNFVRANRAIYDAREDRALLLDAELRQFVPQLQSEVRVRAERMRQLNRDTYFAQNAWATASEFGKPGYRIQASDVFLEKRVSEPWGLFGDVPRDPVTGAVVPRESSWITSRNNTFFVGDVPLFYLPRVSVPAQDPSIPLRRSTFGQDRIFGTQVRFAWDLYKILGLENPPNGNWDLLTDYRSYRGPGLGTQANFSGTNFFGIGGPYFGQGLAYYIHDTGKDNLGLDRRSLTPETNNRYRVSLREFLKLDYNIDLIAEVGLLSDRNFLEQYHESEFDNGKDQETLLYFRQLQTQNTALTGIFRPQANDFENTTEWLPRGDYYVLSEPVLNGAVNWSSHSELGYGRLRRAQAPYNPQQDIFTPIPYLVNSEGLVTYSRHELDAPFNLGPVQMVPYALGEAAFWSQDINGDPLGRLVGSLGLRGSIFAWRVFPYVQSRLLNVNGLAHKMVLESEYAYTNSSTSLGNIPQYNEIDDNAQERFRQRFPFNTYGILPPGSVPAIFDPRFYAVRTGAGRSVTDPYNELLDDQQVLRLAWRHRLQTKVGPPHRLRIKDWMTLDLEGSYFPQANRDNFGQDLGLLSGRYQWFIGDRTTVLANAYYDLFQGAQQLWDIGVQSQRTQRGSLYLGLTQVKGGGVLNSQIGVVAMTYQMSPKWASTFGTSFDVAEARNIGQTMTVTRIGADFLFHLGATYDQSKGNAGFSIAVEPRLGALLAPNRAGSPFGSGLNR